ncbi:Flp family type IVb pilin [Limnohabitans sp.]|jgi:pilus assembly protein Flp/PilA|uniref:Flp family type IVb pilin n=1 Tax=Limnohabitans sp. TaxID=1907725 RepID=UPI0037C16582
MKHVIDLLKNFTRNESGTTALEYGPLVAWVAWVALGITVGTAALGAELGLFFGRIVTRHSTAV